MCLITSSNIIYIIYIFIYTYIIYIIHTFPFISKKLAKNRFSFQGVISVYLGLLYIMLCWTNKGNFYLTFCKDRQRHFAFLMAFMAKHTHLERFNACINFEFESKENWHSLEYVESTEWVGWRRLSKRFSWYIWRWRPVQLLLLQIVCMKSAFHSLFMYKQECRRSHQMTQLSCYSVC